MAQEIADSTLLDTWGSGGNIVEPDISKIIEGWQLGEQPPHEYMNWLQNTFGSKLNHILKNGVANWNNETEYLAGSSVQHNGNIWLCKTTNTNSEPTDVNANWKRIITVESLTTVLGGYVKNSEDETIAGIKTFTSSPIVPSPTVSTQAMNLGTYNNGLGKQGYTHTANATFTGANNKIVMTGIVTALDLEVGDVITFNNANADNNKPHTVESITDNNTIIVNYEHCGNRGNGSLKLFDQTVTNANCKLLAKWFVAPIGLGRALVILNAFRNPNNTQYTSIARPFSVYISFRTNEAFASSANVDMVVAVNSAHTLLGSGQGFMCFDTLGDKTYSVNLVGCEYPTWAELR